MQEKTEDEMEDTRLINNQAEIVGEIVTDFEFSHEIFGEKFYLVHVLVERLSGLTDEIPVLISERIVDVSQDHFGRLIRVKGQYRSYNKHDGEKSRLMLSMYAREVEFLEEYGYLLKKGEKYLANMLIFVAFYHTFSIHESHNH